MSINISIDGELDEDEVIQAVVESRDLESRVEEIVRYEVESEVDRRLNDIDFSEEAREAVEDHFGRYGTGTQVVHDAVEAALADSADPVAIRELTEDVDRLSAQVKDQTAQIAAQSRKLEAVARAFKAFIVDEVPVPGVAHRIVKDDVQRNAFGDPV